MESKYLHETFNSDSSEFDHKFTEYLNHKAKDHWTVKDCSYCHDSDNKKMWASCLFKRKF